MDEQWKERFNAAYMDLGGMGERVLNLVVGFPFDPIARRETTQQSLPAFVVNPD